jgi:PAS domain S-box-containing protein
VVHRPDGRRTALVSWAAPVDLGGPGRADAAVWVLEDWTALRQAEAARSDTEGRFRTVVETMGEALLVVDRAGVVVDCNPAACAAFGRTPEQLRGRARRDWPGDFVREDGAPLPDDDLPVRVALRTGRPVRHAVFGLRPPGGGPAVRWFRVNAMPLGDPAPAGVVATFADVTAEHAAREALRASEEKYRGPVESLPVMVVHADRSQRLRYANPAVRAVTGFALEEIADPAAWAARVHPDDLPRVRAWVEEALAGRPGRVEIRFRPKDGAERTALALSQPTWQDGAVDGVLSILVDVTRERELERGLERAQRLETVGRLSSGVAHDFNNLLTVILTLSRAAGDGAPPGSATRDDLRRIGEAAEQAAALAGQLLALGRRRPLGGPAEVNAAVRRALKLLRGSLPPGVRVEADLAAGELHVPADETQLQQVLMNLCLNARDAMPQGGRLTVRTAAEADGAGAWVRLTVGDDGGGMTEEVRARVFEPFFTTKEGGAGLGLAVVRQIAEGCGGRVEATSSPGKGACFDVWLPAAPPGR